MKSPPNSNVQNTTIDNSSIEASLVSFNAGDTGTAYLTTALGAGTTVADVVTSTGFAFTQVSPITTLSFVSLFTDLSLPADDYFLTFGPPVSGSGAISASNSAAYMLDSSANVGNMMIANGANRDPVFPPASTFVASSVGNRYFRVTSVPEPTSAFIFLFALCVMVGMRKN